MFCLGGRNKVPVANKPAQLDLGFATPSGVRETNRPRRNGEANKLAPEDRPIHDWYRFVLSFPPHLVRDYVRQFQLTPDDRVLDPFCGTATTLVEAKKLGVPSVGVEATPMGYLAGRTKINWRPNPDELRAHARAVAKASQAIFQAEGISDAPDGNRWPPDLRTLEAERASLLLKDSISPLPLHKTLTLLGVLDRQADDRFMDHARLALAKALAGPVGNLHFGPEVGVGPAKIDASVVTPWLAGINRMASDLAEVSVRSHVTVPAQVFHADARDLQAVIEPRSISAVITSPPYPNEKDYSRTTRLESVLLGLVASKAELRQVKQGLVRSNTRSVYVSDTDDAWIADHPEIQRIAAEIEATRIALGKTSGFERQYARVTRLYFGGMMRHLAMLRPLLRPGARLAYVVGDQASYLRVMIRTGQILADLAQSLGYELVRIDLFRTRLATATREQLREEVVVLRWPG
jgi:hypothetical protein